MKLMKIIPAKAKAKKWTAYFMLDNGKEKAVSFGSKGMRDYILMNDKNSKFYEPDKDIREKVKAAYRARHAKDKINDPLSPGSLSWHVLWDLPNFAGSIKKFKNKFKL